VALVVVPLLSVSYPKTSPLLNIDSLADDTGVSHTTARNWLSLLEENYVIFFLQT